MSSRRNRNKGEKLSPAAQARAKKRAEDKRRLRWSSLPKPTEEVQVPYSMECGAHAGLSYGAITARIIASPLWQEVMVPRLNAVDERRGPQQKYSAHHFEAVLLFQRVAAELGYKATRGLLAGDDHEDARRLLDLEEPRGKATRGRKRRRRGVPSEATMSRYRREHFPEDERNAAYAELVERLRELVVPLLNEVTRVLYIDGTKIETHYTCPKYEKRRRRTDPYVLKNGAKVTCWDGGYVPRSAHPDKAGNGWNLIPLWSENGIPLGHRLVKLNDHEATEAIEVLAQFAEAIRPLLPEDPKPRVVIADGAFSTPMFRASARAAGMVENVHGASHADQPTSRSYVKQLNKARIEIEGHPLWHANGHRELLCSCKTHPSISRVAWTDRHGRAKVRTDASCRKCGSISITAGRYRLVSSGKARKNYPEACDRYVKCLPGEVGDLQFGNPLTYHDPLSEVYGCDRRGRNEGFNGIVSSRFGLNKGKRWFRRKVQAELDINVVFTIMLSMSLEELQAGASNASQPHLHAVAGAPPGATGSPPLPLAA